MSSKKKFLLSIISCLFLFPSALNARDLDEYWYGIGVGMSELLCTLKSNGIISNKYNWYPVAITKTTINL